MMIAGGVGFATCQERAGVNQPLKAAAFSSAVFSGTNAVDPPKSPIERWLFAFGSINYR
jgi:hypothetical protein